MAPENKAPVQVNQGLEALKWVRNNLKPKKICLSGESAGGYIATAVAMKDPNVDLLVPIMPMTSNMFLKREDHQFNEFVRKYAHFMRKNYELMVDDPKAHEDDPEIFPNLMSDD